MEPNQSYDGEYFVKAVMFFDEKTRKPIGYHPCIVDEKSYVLRPAAQVVKDSAIQSPLPNKDNCHLSPDDAIAAYKEYCAQNGVEELLVMPPTFKATPKPKQVKQVKSKHTLVQPHKAKSSKPKSLPAARKSSHKNIGPRKKNNPKRSTKRSASRG